MREGHGKYLAVTARAFSQHTSPSSEGGESISLDSGQVHVRDGFINVVPSEMGAAVQRGPYVAMFMALDASGFGAHPLGAHPHYCRDLDELTAFLRRIGLTERALAETLGDLKTKRSASVRVALSQHQIDSFGETQWAIGLEVKGVQYNIVLTHADEQQVTYRVKQGDRVIIDNGHAQPHESQAQLVARIRHILENRRN